MPEPSKISLEWEYYVFVIIPFPGVSWDVCGADPLLGSQSGWKLVKLPLPEHLKLSTLKGSAAVLKEVLYNFFNQFRQAVFFERTFAELRAWTWNRFLQLRQPQLKDTDKLTKLSWVGSARFSTKLPSPWLAQRTDRFGKSFGIQNSQRPGIGPSSAIRRLSHSHGNFRVGQAKHGNVLTLHFSLLAQCNILLTNSAPLLQTSVSRLSCRSMAFTSLEGLSCNCILKKIQAHSSLCWLWYINPSLKCKSCTSWNNKPNVPTKMGHSIKYESICSIKKGCTDQQDAVIILVEMLDWFCCRLTCWFFQGTVRRCGISLANFLFLQRFTETFWCVLVFVHAHMPFWYPQSTCRENHTQGHTGRVKRCAQPAAECHDNPCNAHMCAFSSSHMLEYARTTMSLTF